MFITSVIVAKIVIADLNFLFHFRKCTNKLESFMSETETTQNVKVFGALIICLIPVNVLEHGNVCYAVYINKHKL